MANRGVGHEGRALNFTEQLGIKILHQWETSAYFLRTLAALAKVAGDRRDPRGQPRSLEEWIAQQDSRIASYSCGRRVTNFKHRLLFITTGRPVCAARKRLIAADTAICDATGTYEACAKQSGCPQLVMGSPLMIPNEQKAYLPRFLLDLGLRAHEQQGGLVLAHPVQWSSWVGQRCPSSMA